MPGLVRLRRFARTWLLRRAFPSGHFKVRRYTRREHEHAETPALVIVCLWNRHTRFRDILDDLGRQDFEGGVTLGFWNNDHELSRHYDEELRHWQSETASSTIESVFITHSPINAGGMGRFYLAKKLSSQLGKSYVVFLDDDQQVSPEFLSTVMRQSQPGTLASWWGWKILANDDYWNRLRAKPGEPIDYAGTGGMLADSKIFLLPQLYRDLKQESWFLEDIWLSHVGLQNGYKLVSLEANIEFTMDETNQNHYLASLKPEFYRELAKARANSR